MSWFNFFRLSEEGEEGICIVRAVLLETPTAPPPYKINLFVFQFLIISLPVFLSSQPTRLPHHFAALKQSF